MGYSAVICNSSKCGIIRMVLRKRTGTVVFFIRMGGIWIKQCKLVWHQVELQPMEDICVIIHKKHKIIQQLTGVKKTIVGTAGIHGMIGIIMIAMEIGLVIRKRRMKKRM